MTTAPGPLASAPEAERPTVPAHVGAGNLIYRADHIPRFVRAEGSHLESADGRRYLDAEAANGTAAFGYDRTILADALRHCQDLPALPSFCESDLRLNVLHRLERLFGEATGVPGRVELDLGGAQGMETALRIAFSAVGPGTVVVFEGSFHGRSGVTSMLSASPRYRELLAAWGLEVVRLPVHDGVGCPHPDPARGGCGAACVAAVTRWGSELSGVGGTGFRRGVSAFVFESVQNVGGMAEPDHAVLRAAVDHARANGAVVIADEIFTGMHRTGPRWGFQRSGVTPDIVVASKALTNGAAALSAVWAREPLAGPETYRPGSHSSTYIGIPHALGVARAVLDRWDSWPDAESAMSDLAAAMTTRLAQLQSSHPDLVDGHRAFGGTARLVLTGDHAPLLRRLCLTADPGLGLIVASTGMAPDVINIHPPLVIGANDLDAMTEVLDRSLTLLAKTLEQR
ncbi:aminotransferase class III-fold pyridoxal phosphate-dependent enzyme [Streptomyces sp. NBC_00638]|uniref:aminotransferase class III-fold pyridoxal phosphate-dependent enzyme n=1 Tax=unclassified Streptomyces TaxID=2593676 RepID=UPI0022523C6B|nr:aminotransferase class III-fold pyridoxal phosphate-dependent enzyme [Streptomyces sp. NBC_00638]MCX5008314.1 aminotransferase class III-fold pyridoxal phosphate-dependent enzyme [Streptomyces sp. NBC_00638]